MLYDKFDTIYYNSQLYYNFLLSNTKNTIFYIKLIFNLLVL